MDVVDVVDGAAAGDAYPAPAELGLVSALRARFRVVTVSELEAMTLDDLQRLRVEWIETAASAGVATLIAQVCNQFGRFVGNKRKFVARDAAGNPRWEFIYNQAEREIYVLRADVGTPSPSAAFASEADDAAWRSRLYSTGLEGRCLPGAWLDALDEAHAAVEKARALKKALDEECQRGELVAILRSGCVAE